MLSAFQQLHSNIIHEQICKATVPRGFFSLPILCKNVGIARAVPPCTSNLTNDLERTPVITMLRQCFRISRKISIHASKFSPDVSKTNNHRRYMAGDISPNSAEQSANIRRGTPRFKMSQAHRRHIGDVLNMLVWTYAIYIWCDDMADGLVIHRGCSRTVLWSGDALLRVYGPYIYFQSLTY